MSTLTNALDALEKLIEEETKRRTELNHYMQHSEAWLKVTDVLSEVSPGWTNRDLTGADCAVKTIRELAEKANQINQKTVYVKILP